MFFRKRRVCIQTDNICSRRLLDVKRISEYLKQNRCNLVTELDKAEDALFFGCAFNDTTEQSSLLKLEEISKKPVNIFLLGGIADIQGEKIKREGLVDPEKIIKNGEYEKLDNFFANKYRLRDIREVNEPYSIQNTTDRQRGKNIEGTYSVQVAHGCNDNCSYCGDKLVVKSIKSKPVQDCIEEVARGIKAGYRKIELLGDDVGAYGLDIDLTIMDLLNKISRLEGNFYLSMQEVNIKYLIKHYDELDNILGKLKLTTIVVGFQSGSDRILKLMARGYKRADVERLINLLNRHKVKCRFHAIVGFPSETYDDFLETISVIKNGNFKGGTLFKYDDRNYASAYKITPKVKEEEKTKRICDALNIFQESKYECTVLPDKIYIRRT